MTEKVSYLIIKIGNSIFSTTMFDKPKHVLDLKRNGEKQNIWIKGEFTEGEDHTKLAFPIPFELNIYVLNEKQKTLR